MKRKLNVLVACESSGRVRDAFRKLGHNAWSCDLLPCDADPQYHLQCDVLQVIADPRKLVYFRGRNPLPKKWDLMIAHPPCTYLANSGVSWLYKWVPESKTLPAMQYRVKNEPRWKAMRDAAWFFGQLYYHASKHIPQVCVENPIMHYHAADLIGALANGGPQLRPTQIIQPYMFGHLETKATGLYLRGLPKLQPTVPDVKEAKRQTMMRPAAERQRLHWLPPGPARWKERSKTFSGIARAMAAQWGGKAS